MQKRPRRGTQGHQEEGHDEKEGHQRGHQRGHRDTKKNEYWSTKVLDYDEFWSEKRFGFGRKY